jgi:putative ABC transport system substrate-binding protein
MKMKRLSRIAAIVLTVVMVLAAVGCSGGNKKISIGIIQLAEHVALDNAYKGFIDALKENGYVDGENITIDYQNAQGDQNNLSTISDRFVSNKSDLVLAIATPAAQAIAGKTEDIPILGTAITDYVVANLADSNEVPGRNISGTTDMNPVKEQIDLVVKMAPEAKTIGVLYTSSEDNSILQAAMAKDAIEALGLNYVEVTVTNTNDVQQAVQSIVGQCDAIYIPTDNTFAASMPIVHGVTSVSKTPVIAGEAGMVSTGGLATLGINYYDLGFQTGLMAVKILKGEAEISTMPIQGSTKFDYVINGTVAEEIGITIPADLQQYVIDGE